MHRRARPGTGRVVLRMGGLDEFLRGWSSAAAWTAVGILTLVFRFVFSFRLDRAIF